MVDRKDCPEKCEIINVDHKNRVLTDAINRTCRICKSYWYEREVYTKQYDDEEWDKLTKAGA